MLLFKTLTGFFTGLVTINLMFISLFKLFPNHQSFLTVLASFDALSGLLLAGFMLLIFTCETKKQSAILAAKVVTPVALLSLFVVLL